jgi:hypothetical protein
MAHEAKLSDSKSGEMYMLRRLFRYSELTDLSALAVDGAAAKGRMSDTSIKRNPRPAAIGDDPNEIFNRAREIYFRARQTNRSRPVSII